MEKPIDLSRQETNPNQPSSTLPPVKIYYEGLWAYADRFLYDFPGNRSRVLYCLSLFGNKVATKGIVGALISRASPVWLEISRNPSESFLPAGRTYRIFSKPLPCGAQHIILIDSGALLKTASPLSFFIIDRSGDPDQLYRIYYTFLDRLVALPLLPAWAKWLWERGIQKKEITKLQGYGIEGYQCRILKSSLEEDLCKAIAAKELRFTEGDTNETGGAGESGVLPDP